MPTIVKDFVESFTNDIPKTKNERILAKYNSSLNEIFFQPLLCRRDQKVDINKTSIQLNKI